MAKYKLIKTVGAILLSSLLCGCWNTNQYSDYLLIDMDLKGVEKVPENLKDELDFSGPVNRGIIEDLQSSTEEMVNGLGKDNSDVTGTSNTNSTETSNIKATNTSNKTDNSKHIKEKRISFSKGLKYASNSKINTGKVTLYTNYKNNGHTICINAGHGTKGGESQKTLCHPDGTLKVTGGSTAKGAIYATAIASGMTFDNGTTEAEVTLRLAKIVKKKLLNAGYNVLMIRETNDVQLDNIARTVLANEYADCHISLHWDSSNSDKGAFYISVPEGSYRNMEPVKSNWKEHNRLGKTLVNSLRDSGIKIYSNGYMPLDLTQTSYSTIPSIDLELGDKGSDISDQTLKKMADAILKGLNNFYK